MFMKQYNYKPRSNSQSSGSSGQGVAGSPPKDESKTGAGAANTIAQQANAGATGVAGRRRSSAAGAEKFAGLSGVKRNSQDQTMADRKASWADQKPGQQGILGGMWNSFTKGS